MMLNPWEYAFFGVMYFVLIVCAVALGLTWWRTFVNPKFPSRGLPERVNNQEVRIAHLEKRVADQEEELGVLRQRVVELSELLSGSQREEAQ